MKRGDTVTVAAGSGYGSKPRPAVVVQGDSFARLNTVILALFTTNETGASDIRPRIEPDTGNGLRAPSDLMADILVTVPRDRVGAIVGKLSAADMGRVDTALMTVLGFAR